MAATASKSFGDTIFARLIALVLAVVFGAILYLNWGSDIEQLFAGSAPAIPITAGVTQVETTNTALEACLKQRVGDVDTMKSDGLINDSQYAQFRQRAEDLCRGQNPG